MCGGGIYQQAEGGARNILHQELRQTGHHIGDVVGHQQRRGSRGGRGERRGGEWRRLISSDASRSSSIIAAAAAIIIVIVSTSAAVVVVAVASVATIAVVAAAAVVVLGASQTPQDRSQAQRAPMASFPPLIKQGTDTHTQTQIQGRQVEQNGQVSLGYNRG